MLAVASDTSCAASVGDAALAVDVRRQRNSMSVRTLLLQQQ
ncbi:MAG TPA: hypothetical protein VFX25_04645 [Streptosporangiaceae bacterium]|nr:hypothetical protein [Streptosporangiaceae bacterium]